MSAKVLLHCIALLFLDVTHGQPHKTPRTQVLRLRLELQLQNKLVQWAWLVQELLQQQPIWLMTFDNKTETLQSIETISTTMSMAPRW